MPTYRVTDPTSGRTLQLTGDAPPSEADLNTIFAQYGHGSPSPQAGTTAPLPNSTGASFGQRLESGAEAITNATGLTPIAKGLGALLGFRPQTDMPTTPQAAGSAIQGIASVGGLLLGPGESVLNRLSQGAVLGAGQALGQGVAKGGSAGQVANQTGLGALYGAGTMGLLEGAGAATKGVANKAADYAYNNVVNTPIRQLLSGQESLAQGLKNRGIAGGYGSIIQQVKSLLQDNGQQLNQIVQDKAKTPIDLTPMKNALMKVQSQLANTPGESTAPIDTVLKHFESIDTLPLADAQELKQNLQKAVNNAFLNQNPTGLTQAQRVAASGLRAAIEQAAPEVVPLNKELSFGQRALPQLEKAAQRKESPVHDFLSLAAGKLLGESPLAIGEQLLSRPGFGTPIAQGALKTANALPPEISQLLQRALSGYAGRASQ